jgi:hypothetical protein
MAATLREAGFVSSKADPDVWMRPQVKPNGKKYWEYYVLHCYVDDILYISQPCTPIGDGLPGVLEVHAQEGQCERTGCVFRCDHQKLLYSRVSGPKQSAVVNVVGCVRGATFCDGSRARITGDRRTTEVEGLDTSHCLLDTDLRSMFLLSWMHSGQIIIKG